MARFMAIYRLPQTSEDAARFSADYRDTHVPLLVQTPGLVNIEVSRVRETVHGEPGLLLVAVMTFGDDQAMAEAMRSAPWREAGRNLASIGGLELATMATLEPAETIPLPQAATRGGTP